MVSVATRMRPCLANSDEVLEFQKRLILRVTGRRNHCKLQLKEDRTHSVKKLDQWRVQRGKAFNHVCLLWFFLIRFWHILTLPISKRIRLRSLLFTGADAGTVGIDYVRYVQYRRDNAQTENDRLIFHRYIRPLEEPPLDVDVPDE